MRLRDRLDVDTILIALHLNNKELKPHESLYIQLVHVQ